ncbi:MAG: hybrid sensor histidine kinase/response regulator, partial [Gammaproteobacteria bacterium]|nr:hybrid sensor histidine kinase/response regulator [Gammaproteobacteria bacterium]
MTERRDHFALDWIKRELDETLKSARQSLEAYAESGQDETRMRACLTYVHQVHGTLLMLELTGVTVLSDEMEQLAQALLIGNVKDSAAAQQVLMQAILQLPAFLEEIQKGLPDSRRAVVPLANELRLARGEKPFPDAGTGAAVNLHLVATEDSLKRFDQIDGTDKARKIRAAYQQVLLSILRGQDREASLSTLNKVALGLERISEKSPIGLLWRAFGIFVKSLAEGQVELSGDVVKLLRRVDAEIKTLASDGSAALSRPVDMQLLRTLVDDARDRGFTSKDLDQLAAVLDSEPEEERLGISRREAMHTAAAALREELALVKDRLDLYVRSDRRSADTLTDLAAPLKQIGSTLSILGFESSRAVVADQVDSLNQAAARGTVEDGVLMSAAAALLQVDENLAGIAQDRNRRLGATGETTAVISAAQLAVLAEARNGLEQVKQAVVDYVSAQWDARHLEGAPDLLNAVRGALAMVPLPQAADQLGRCGRYVRERLLAGETPDWTMLDAFADALSGVDYFLERLSDDAGMPGKDILGGVERSLSVLGYGEGMAPGEAKPRANHRTTACHQRS